MVSSIESFSSLKLTDVPSIHMGDDSQIQAKGKGSIKLQHGVFKNVLYVPSLATNLVSIYQMTLIGSPNRVVFGYELVEISYISTGKLVVKGVANHASKAYEFSHFLSYLDPVQYQLPFEREGKFILPKPFANDNVSINVLYSESEADDQVESFFGIEDEFQSYPVPYPVPTPNPRPNGIKR